MGVVQILIQNCLLSPSPSIYARKGDQADADALERLALLVETFPDHCISRGSLERFLLKIRAGPRLTKNKTAASGKRTVVLERSRRVEQVVSRRRHPPSPLFRRKSTEKGSEGSFEQKFERLPLELA